MLLVDINVVYITHAKWCGFWCKGYNVFSVSMKITFPPVYPLAPGICAVTG